MVGTLFEEPVAVPCWKQYTSSNLNTVVKQHWARSVWKTTYGTPGAAGIGLDIGAAWRQVATVGSEHPALHWWLCIHASAHLK